MFRDRRGGLASRLLGEEAAAVVDVALTGTAVLGVDLLAPGVGLGSTSAEESIHLGLLGLNLRPRLLVGDDVPHPSPPAAVAATAEAAEEEQDDQDRGDTHGRPKDGLAVGCVGERDDVSHPTSSARMESKKFDKANQVKVMRLSAVAVRGLLPLDPV